MVTEIEVFQFPSTGQQIRTVLRDGEPWFLAREVCAVLGITNTTDFVRSLEDDEYELVPAALVSNEGRPQDFVNLVTEAGLYSLILRSRKPEAKAFKRWITHDVLPTIRKTGRYEVAPLDELEVARRYVASLEARKELEARVAELEPSAAAWDHLASGDGDWQVADAAKILSRDPAITIGRDRLFAQMRQWSWIYRAADGRWRVYQSQVNIGRLSEIPQSHYHARTGDLVLDAPQVRIKPKGLAEIHRRLGGTAALAVESAA